MTSPPYRVLARKYRPQRFDQLIGQDAVVRTLANAIESGRLSHAWLLTGVRGVGKTTTARLIAKALNCIGPDGTGGPTISPCDLCEPCRAIAEGRFIDVLEMDAASNTGVDKMRELLEGVPYGAVSARFKIYVVDEVHMLSTSSFNALLKTLEEPPPHVKFIFATTEVGKLPVTILSRCQRFDLRRIPADKLAAHYAAVCAAEGVEAEPHALALIARAAEGSARDGLSLLDQAIAHGGGAVRAEAVQDMLGMADRGRVRALLGAVLAGEQAAVLSGIGALNDMGADPAGVLKEMLDLVHATARVAAGAGADGGRAAEEQAEIAAWARALGAGALHRLWQLLLKGYAEVQSAPLPLEAAEMALLRMVYAAGLPDPGALMRRLEAGEGAATVAPPAPAPRTERAPVAVLPRAAPEPARVGRARRFRGAGCAGCGQSRGVAGALSARLRPAGPVRAADAGDRARGRSPRRFRAGTRPLPRTLHGRALDDRLCDRRCTLLARAGRGRARRGSRRANSGRVARGLSGCRADRLWRGRRRTPGDARVNMDEILKAASEMQAQLAKAQDKLDEIEVEGVSGGGLVRVKASAKGRIISLHLEPSLVDPTAKEMLEDLIVAAFNDARAKADAASGAEMGKLTQGLPMPPGFKLPF